MARYLLTLLLLAAACSKTPEAATTLAPSPTATATTLPPAAVPHTTVVDSDLPCRPPIFAPRQLPARVADTAPAAAAVEVDQWTALPGTSLAIWTDATGTPVVALVRGALPPERWSARPAVIEIRGTDAALGPLSDGMWAAAWFEGPSRCDDYTLYVYPPTSAEETQAIAESIS
ncbi:MAG: hypothetical protein ACE5MI_05860 [Acidimicrobiia bacterium]